MNKAKSADEQPKEAIAKKVVTAKRRYFVPDHGVSVEANSPEEAVKLAAKQEKEGDA